MPRPRRPPAPGLRRVLAAEGVSNFGSMLSRLAIPWLAALSLQASPAQMAGLVLADVLAGALGALLLGPWVDRQGKRAVMLLADGARFALLGLVALAAWQGWASMALLTAVSAAQGALTLAFELARSAWMAQRLTVADLPRHNAQLSAVGSLSETAAFALGGWMYQGLGAVGALLLDACSYALSAACLKGLPEAPAAPLVPSTTPPQGAAVGLVHGSAATASQGSAATTSQGPAATASQWWDDAQAGWRAIAAQPALRALAGIEALLAASLALSGTSYMIFVSRDLGLATGPLGLVFALGGLGAVIGAGLAPWLGRRLGPGRAMAAGLVALAAGAACVPLAQGAVVWGALAWLAAQQIIGDAGHTLHAVHAQTWRQTAAPAELLARVDAGLRSVGQFATLGAALVGGVLGTAWGTPPVLWLAAGCAVAAAGLAWGRLASLPPPAMPRTLDGQSVAH